MKKYIVMFFVLAVIIIFSACGRKNTTETEMKFTEGVWLKKYPDNYACFKMESPEGFQIVCDPFNVNETLQPDIVTESHQHLDHTDTSNLEQPYKLITDPGEYKYDEVDIQGYSGKHDRGDKGDTNNIYVFKMQDITIAHFGSQGELPSDDVLNQIGTVDVLLIQVFASPDSNKLTMDDAEVIVSKLKPKIIIPEHGDSNIGYLLAEHYNVEEEVEDSGHFIITRDMLDNIKSIRVVNMDNY